MPRLLATQAWLVLALALLGSAAAQWWVANVFWAPDAELERRVATIMGTSLATAGVLILLMHVARRVPAGQAMPDRLRRMLRWVCALTTVGFASLFLMVLILGGATGECHGTSCGDHYRAALDVIHWSSALLILAAGANLVPRPAPPPA